MFPNLGRSGLGGCGRGFPVHATRPNLLGVDAPPLRPIGVRRYDEVRQCGF